MHRRNCVSKKIFCAGSEEVTIGPMGFSINRSIWRFAFLTILFMLNAAKECNTVLSRATVRLQFAQSTINSTR